MAEKIEKLNVSNTSVKKAKKQYNKNGNLMLAYQEEVKRLNASGESAKFARPGSYTPEELIEMVESEGTLYRPALVSMGLI